MNCETCHLPLRCEACGVAEADTATSYINDDLQWVAIRVCHRCDSIWHVAESDRAPYDARAVELYTMTLRNMDAWEQREFRRTTVPA